MNLENVYEYRLAKGLIAERSVTDELMQMLKKPLLSHHNSSASGKQAMGNVPVNHYRRRMVDMYEVNSLGDPEMKITGPFRISAKIPPTPAVIVAIPKTLRRTENPNRVKLSRSKEEFAKTSRVSASLNAHISNVNESFAFSFPFRHRIRVRPN